jgi:hypothetical protein
MGIVDVISADPLPLGHALPGWGVPIKFPDGSVLIKPDPWE